MIKLAVSHAHSQPVRLLFSSSIAVVGRHPASASDPPQTIAELPLEDPSAVTHFGYAEAKWVCERMFEEASRLYGHKLAASSVRIGQMTGAEATGAWNTAEHIPMIVKSCVAVGKVPDLEGVSHICLSPMYVKTGGGELTFVFLFFLPFAELAASDGVVDTSRSSSESHERAPLCAFPPSEPGLPLGQPGASAVV